MRGLHVGMLSAEGTRAAEDCSDRFRASDSSCIDGSRGIGPAAGSSYRISTGAAIGNEQEYAGKAACGTARGIRAHTRGKSSRADHRSGTYDGRNGSSENGNAAKPRIGGEEFDIGKGENIECHAAGSHFEGAGLHGQRARGNVQRRLGAREEPLQKGGSAFRTVGGELVRRSSVSSCRPG